jgi:hypothetical protein
MAPASRGKDVRAKAPVFLNASITLRSSLSFQNGLCWKLALKIEQATSSRMQGGLFPSHQASQTAQLDATRIRACVQVTHVRTLRPDGERMDGCPQPAES